MRLISWNVNGIRAAASKGLLPLLDKGDNDFVFLQEVKANQEQLDFFLRNPGTYKSFFNSAEKKGYSGVAVYYRTEPLQISTTLGFERFDKEGRFIRFDYKDLVLINIYIPHGGRDKKDLSYKMDLYAYLINYLEKLKDKNVILGGDLNIAHTELDLARPYENVENIMFTPEERKQLDHFEAVGYTDTFRNLHQIARKYTWWSYAFDSRNKDIGWRLDYFFVSSGLKTLVRDCDALKEIEGSDHCPVLLNVDFPLLD